MKRQSKKPNETFLIELEINGVIVEQKTVTAYTYEFRKMLLKRKAIREAGNKHWAIFIRKTKVRRPFKNRRTISDNYITMLQSL